MRFEFSAGGIVHKKEGSRTLILVAQHSYHHGWVFPKGLIGDHPSAGSRQRRGSPGAAGQAKKETKEQAALREVQEETGVIAKIIEPLTPVTYWFVFSSKGGSTSGGKGEKIKKTVYYFLMKYVSGDTKNHDFEMENVKWLEKGEVLQRLTYPSDKKVWQEAEKMLE